MNKTYRYALIGCGWIGADKHINGILAMPDAELVAVCDLIPERMDAMKREHNLGDSVVAFTDYREMLKAGNIDVVHIATPNPLHCEMTCAALEAGCHVLVEKPMACSAAECDQMIATAKKAGKKLSVGYQWRYRPSAILVKKVAASGKLGEIYYAKANATRYRGVPTWGEYMGGGNGGGVYIDGVPHALDLTLWAMDNYEPVSVKANLYNKMKTHPEGNGWGPWEANDFKVEDSGFAIVTMKNGATVYIEASWIINMLGEDMKTTLCGTLAGLDMVGGPSVVRMNGVELGTTYVNHLENIPSPAPGSVQPLDPMKAEARFFLDSIINDAEPFVKPEEAKVVTQIIEGVYESAKTGKEVFF